MTVSKTRTKLVEVARQLFARKGVEATTMNDIAVASKKGRRTLYTYFKNKEQIYLAVAESELEVLSDTMEKVARKPIAVNQKILELITTHLDLIKMLVYRNGTLRADSSGISGGWRQSASALMLRKYLSSAKCCRKARTCTFSESMTWKSLPTSCITASKAWRFRTFAVR